MLAKKMGAKKVITLVNKPSYADLVESQKIDIAVSPQQITLGALLTKVRRGDVARVHSGDPSLYGAIAEQIRRLRADGIPYEIIPGVPAYAAMAAAMGQELTIPEIAQSIVLTRMSMKSTGMPEGETLENFARTGATLAIHLGIRALREIERQLIPFYGEDCPVVVIYRASWPDQLIIRGTFADIREKVRAAKITRTALIMVGPALSDNHGFPDSALYDATKPHVLRPKVK